MAEAVYILCALTSISCAVLLTRSWRRTRTRLLLWTALCFAGLAINNIMVFVDLVLVPDVDLEFWRNLATLSGIGVLVFGLIWDSQ